MVYTIRVPYIGGVLSKNSYKWGTRGTKKSVKKWMEKLADDVKDIPKFKEYEIGVSGKFESERRPDLQNLFEVISDSLEKGLQTNDKHFRFRDEGYVIGTGEPEIMITIEGVR